MIEREEEESCEKGMGRKMKQKGEREGNGIEKEKERGGKREKKIRE